MVAKPGQVIFNANSPPKNGDNNKSPPLQKSTDEVPPERRLLEDAYREGVKEGLKETLKIRGN